MSDTRQTFRFHLGRSWRPHELEDDCSCGKAPCGLVDSEQIDPECPQHAFGAAKTMRQMHTPAECPGAHEMEVTGCWGDEGTGWFPRSQVTRAQARTMFANECGVPWIDVHVYARWMRYAPEHPGASEYDGEFWVECNKDEPGAFQVWRCE